ncbi:helix-turn-helix domain-containing protein, partial [Verrucomicrobiota bacterium]
KARGVRDLINMGETFALEFKSCLRWNLKTGKKDPAIEHANLKTIAAFLNSSGGTLLIGVRDDGSIEGIETDALTNPDKFARHFWQLVKARLGQDICPFIRTAFKDVDSKTVFAVDCVGSPKPVFLNQKQGDDEFYIRVGPSSAKLTIREALKYISQRFEENE